MIFVRIVLAPFAFLYGLITYIRNKLFDLGYFPTFEIPVKAIVVGNLSVGGTGKTPHVFYIAQKMQKIIDTAILSRGYGRKSKGYKDVLEDSISNEVGDEPLLLKKRLGSHVHVAVCENRRVGVIHLIKKFKSKLIVLDDAFQHRKVKAGLNIILTEFNRPFFMDFPMPMGRLREFRTGKARGDVFIVTKCPDDISEIQKEKFVKEIGIDPQNVFFSKITYSSFQTMTKNKVENIKSILLVTAIADDLKIVEYLSSLYSVKTFKFRDHHSFTKEDITKIHLKFELLPHSNSIILTTEKDFVKLVEFDEVINGKYPWFFLPIDIEIENKNEFNQLLMNYVGTI
jgi:tetraacyldisaccharide 4'-kinase